MKWYGLFINDELVSVRDFVDNTWSMWCASSGMYKVKEVTVTEVQEPSKPMGAQEETSQVKEERSCKTCKNVATDGTDCCEAMVATKCRFNDFKYWKPKEAQPNSELNFLLNRVQNYYQCDENIKGFIVEIIQYLKKERK